MSCAQGILVLLAESGSFYSIVWVCILLVSDNHHFSLTCIQVTFIASTAYTMIKGSTPITHAISDFIPSFVVRQREIFLAAN